MIFSLASWYGEAEAQVKALRSKKLRNVMTYVGLKRLSTEDNRAHRLREHEYGGDGNVPDKMRMFERCNAASH